MTAISFIVVCNSLLSFRSIQSVRWRTGTSWQLRASSWPQSTSPASTLPISFGPGGTCSSRGARYALGNGLGFTVSGRSSCPRTTRSLKNCCFECAAGYKLHGDWMDAPSPGAGLQRPHNLVQGPQPHAHRCHLQHHWPWAGAVKPWPPLSAGPIGKSCTDA